MGEINPKYLKLMKKLMKQADKEGIIQCPECSKKLKPNTKKCSCGWKNILFHTTYFEKRREEASL